jgi:hypothetical protein
MTYYSTGRIIRSPHTEDFFIAQSSVMRDRQLSAQTRGLIGNLLTRPDNWSINIKFLCEEMCMGIVALKKSLRELEENGYLVRNRIRDTVGRFIGTESVIIETPLKSGKLPPKPSSPTVQKPTVSIPSGRQNDNIRSTESNNYRNEEISNLSPTPQEWKWEEEEIDFWLDSPSEVVQTEVEQAKAQGFGASNIDLHQVELVQDLCTAKVSGEERSSAADYIQTTTSIIKPSRKERRAAQREATWVEFGKENGLWESLEELQGFMEALYRHAVNNPRLHTPSKWVESEVQKTCERGTGTHWMEHCAGLVVGTVDQKPWADVYGNVDLSFRSYIEQSKFGESGNSTSRAVELAAQVLADSFKAGLLWNEYQRRLERELEEKAKCELLGVTYSAPSVLKPKSQVSTAATAQTQQILGIDAASQVYQPGIAQSVSVPALEAAEVESNLSMGEAPWDLIAEKMSVLGEKMGFSKSNSKPSVISLSEVYAEVKPVNQAEAKEFSVWYDLAKAEGLVDYSYGDPQHHAIVVLADGSTALPWREARNLFLGRS